MNLIRDNYNEKKQNNSIITMIIVIMVILAVVAGLLVALVSSLNSKRFKFYVDKTPKNVSEQVFTEIDGVRYVNVKTISDLVGYEYNNGEYNNPYQEDKSKCYVKSDNEIASFIAGSNRMYKVVLDNQNIDSNTTDSTGNSTTKTSQSTQISQSTTTTKNNTASSTSQATTSLANKTDANNVEYYELSNEVKMINGEIYASEQAIRIGFNIYFKYDKEVNTVNISTIPFLVQSYSKFEGAVLDDKCEFSNKKLLLYDMILVKNTKDEYGVKKISSGEAILGTKYAAIKFIESSMNFIVTTQNGKQGISSMSQTKIAPQYDELKQLDKDLDLYLVRNENKYGVINGEDQVVVYIEYDQIGINAADFVNNNIENKYVLFDKYIPAKRDGKWGLLSIGGKISLPIEYDSLGCIAGPSITKSENNLLLIPDLQGIVVSKGGLYGLMTPNGSKLVPASLTEIYKVTNSGVNTYYMTYNEQKIDVIEWVKAKTNETTKKTENTVTDTTTNQVPTATTTPVTQTPGTTIADTNSNNGSNPVYNTNPDSQTSSSDINIDAIINE